MNNNYDKDSSMSKFTELLFLLSKGIFGFNFIWGLEIGIWEKEFTVNINT